MNTKICMIAVILGVIALFNPVYGLKCYKCTASDTVSCSKEDRSTWPTVQCTGREDKCVFYEFETFNGGKPHGKLSQRRCTADPHYCSFVTSSTNEYLSIISNSAYVRQTQCEFCKTNLCN